MATTAPGTSLLDKVRAIAPIIRANAANAERDRQLSKVTVDAMMDAGLYRMCVPLALGGLETDPVSAMRVMEEVSRLDSAAGWNVMIAQASPLFCAWLPAQGSREIFEGHPDSLWLGRLCRPGERYRSKEDIGSWDAGRLLPDVITRPGWLGVQLSSSTLRITGRGWTRTVIRSNCWQRFPRTM